MDWIQQNWSILLFGLLIGFLLFRGQIMAKIFRVSTISVHDLSTLLANEQPPVVIDVRTPTEFKQTHMQQARLFPLNKLGSEMSKLSERYKGRDIAVICRSGNRSLMGAVAFKKAGFENVYNVSGGLLTWESNGYPVTRQG